jgi:UPF0755 protein
MQPKNIIKAFFGFLGSLISILFSFSYHIIIIATILGVSAAFFSMSYMKVPGPLREHRRIVIASGTSVITISQQLAQNEVIKFPEVFAVIIKVLKYGKSLQAGEYEFSPHIAPIEIFKKMESGDVVIRKITLPEGLYTSQILELISADPAQSGDIPENIAQGELLPETYEYQYGDLRANMLKRMQEARRKVLSELWDRRQEGLPLASQNEALVLASIIEKETALPDERRRIAAVFINRLRKNMRLQTDPTVIYAVTGGKYVLNRPLSHHDLEIESLYNTYKNQGLPPTPICNPGRASIEAALNPINTDELYFVASGNGGHVFSSNIKQHNANVAKLRKLEQEAQKNHQTIAH